MLCEDGISYFVKVLNCLSLLVLQGRSVNYFVPPRPLEREKVIRCKSEAQPKIKISYPSMSLTVFSVITAFNAL